MLRRESIFRPRYSGARLHNAHACCGGVTDCGFLFHCTEAKEQGWKAEQEKRGLSWRRLFDIRARGRHEIWANLSVAVMDKTKFLVNCAKLRT
jgi:hypothetical protein